MIVTRGGADAAHVPPHPLFLSSVNEVSIITPERVTFASPAVTVFQHPSAPPARRAAALLGGFEGQSSHMSRFQSRMVADSLVGSGRDDVPWL